MIRVGVLGAAGRMGRLVCQAVADDPELDLVAAISRSRAGEPLGALIGRSGRGRPRSPTTLDTLMQAEAEVAVDFTRPDAVMDNVRWAIEHGVHIVVGTTRARAGRPGRDRRSCSTAEGNDSNVIVAPNFAIGAVLMQRFAAEAARVLPGRRRSSSCTTTARRTRRPARRWPPAGAWRRRAARARWGPDRPRRSAGVRGGDVDGVRVHSVRLPGLVAHQEVIFGGVGETLTIRHDSLYRELVHARRAPGHQGGALEAGADRRPRGRAGARRGLRSLRRRCAWRRRGPGRPSRPVRSARTGARWAPVEDRCGPPVP